jgi:general secretion pathway protein M
VSDLAPWLSRLAALLVLAVVLALVHAGLIAPYLDHVGALDERLANRATVLERMRMLSEAPPSGATTEPAAAPSTALLLPEVSDAQAIGTLQDRLKAFAARDGLELQNIQVLPRAELPAVARLAVRLRAVGDVAALNRFLHAVEAAEPVLLVDNLRIQSRTPRATPGSVAPGNASAALDVQLDVIGFKADAS